MALRNSSRNGKINRGAEKAEGQGSDRICLRDEPCSEASEWSGDGAEEQQLKRENQPRSGESGGTGFRPNLSEG